MASKEASEPPSLEQQSPLPPAITKDQPVSQAEAATNAVAAPIEKTAEPKTPPAGIATKSSEPSSPPTADNRLAGKLAAKAAGTDDKLKSPQCERAKAMIGNYAFTEIEATSCEGNIYHFIAVAMEKSSQSRSACSRETCLKWKSWSRGRFRWSMPARPGNSRIHEPGLSWGLRAGDGISRCIEQMQLWFIQLHADFVTNLVRRGAANLGDDGLTMSEFNVRVA